MCAAFLEADTPPGNWRQASAILLLHCASQNSFPEMRVNNGRVAFCAGQPGMAGRHRSSRTGKKVTVGGGVSAAGCWGSGNPPSRPPIVRHSVPRIAEKPSAALNSILFT